MAHQNLPVGGPYLGAVPPLPAIKDMNVDLAAYLRTFALWCQGNFNSTLQKRTATGQLLMQSTTGNTVWQITIDDAGALHAAQLNPGSHQ